jgi:hypothetical protein
MIFACRTPHTPAMLFSRTDGLDMKVSTRQKQGATRHNRAGAKGDNSASSAPEGPRDGPGLPADPASGLSSGLTQVSVPMCGAAATRLDVSSADGLQLNS